MRGWRQAIVRVFFLALLLQASCVTPPKVDKAQVLPEKELQVIATMKRGKDYAAAGRLDLAEYEYRKVLGAGADNSSIYNDLGYVLQALGRLDEAEGMFRAAIARAPRNIIARDNLARLLVVKEDVTEAKLEFEKVLDLYNTFTKRDLLETIGQDFTTNDLTGVYRNLSMLEYLDGNFDEAICYSRKAFELSGDVVQTGQHARLLLSLGMAPQALEVLKRQVNYWQETAAPKVVLDLLIALYSTGDYRQSAEIAESLINRNDLDSHDRQTARLVKLLLSTRQASVRLADKSNRAKLSADVLSDAEEREGFEALAEEFPGLCKTYVVDPDEYWPDTLREEIESEIKTLCKDDELVYPGTNSGTSA